MQPVYFNVQKTTPFSDYDTPVPFDLELFNVGNYMNAANGVFESKKLELKFSPSPNTTLNWSRQFFTSKLIV